MIAGSPRVWSQRRNSGQADKMAAIIGRSSQEGQKVVTAGELIKELCLGPVARPDHEDTRRIDDGYPR